MVQAQMALLLGSLLLSKGDYERAIEFLVRARDAIPFQTDPRLVVISLVRYSFRVLQPYQRYSKDLWLGL